MARASQRLLGLLLLVLLSGSAAWAANTLVPSITASSTTATPGATLTFTLGYVNTNPNGNNRVITVTRNNTITGFPIGLTGVTFGGTGATGANYNSGSGTISFSNGGIDLATGSTALDFTISFVVPGGGLAAFTVTTAPTGVRNGAAATVAPVSASVTVAPPGPADVSATVTGPTYAPAGSSATFSVVYTNNGPNSALNVVPTLTLAAGLGTGAVSASNFGVYDNATGIVTFPTRTMGNGDVFAPVVRVIMPASGTRVGVAKATSTSDPTAGNNNGTAAGATATITSNQVADVAIAVNGPTAATPGSVITYSVSLSNLGPSSATGVTAQLVLGGSPTGITVPSGNGSVAGNTVTLTTGGSLASGASVGYQIRFTVPATGPVTGTASAASTTAPANGGGDPVAANNNGTAQASLISTAVVSSTPSERCGTPGTGLSLTYSGAQNVNTYYPGTADAAAGQKSVSIGAAAYSGTAPVAPASTQRDLVAGDLVLIMQMQGADINTTNTSSYGDGYAGDPGYGNSDVNFTAGRFEYGIVATVTGGGTGITLVDNLVYNYQNATATATAGQKRFQVIRVPQYQNFTLSANLTAPAWNGATGGGTGPRRGRYADDGRQQN